MPPSPHPKNYQSITTDDALYRYLRECETAGLTTIALDIEAEYNLHVYGERLCLIQIFDGTTPTIVDPVRIGRDALAALFEHDSLAKLMYDASSDQALLFKSFGFRIRPLIDLRPAADLLEFTRRDLGSLLEQTLGLTIERKKRYQQYNWTRRPIERGAIEYALLDVAHLYTLHDELRRQLAERNLLAEFERRNEEIQSRPIDLDRQPRLFRSGEYLRLNKSERARFDRLYELRDGCARELDVPPDWVLPKQQLFLAARARMQPHEFRTPSLPPRARQSATYAGFLRDVAAALETGNAASRA